MACLVNAAHPVYPQAVLKKNSKGDVLALHLAVRWASTMAIMVRNPAQFTTTASAARSVSTLLRFILVRRISSGLPTRSRHCFA
jgi:hypothetical protein